MENQNKQINFPLFVKLLALSGILISVIIVISLLSSFSYDKLSGKDRFSRMIFKYKEISKELASMEHRRRDDIALSFKKDTKNINKYLEFIDSIANITNLADEKKVFSVEYSDYKKNISSFIYNIKKIGLTENDGIEGIFRKNIHNIERFLYKVEDFEAISFLLQARRSEKDYMMRHRDEYIEKVNQNINKLRNRLYTKYRNVDSAIIYVDNYSKSFKDYLEAFNNLRFSYLSIKQNEYNLDRIFDLKFAVLERQAQTAQNIVNPLMITSIILGVILTFIYARTITKPVVELQKATLQVAKGDLKVKLSMKSDDEFSQLANFFNNMVQSIEQNNRLILQQNKDLTDINEELKTLNATKDKLFSIIAHDLKNPLSSFKAAIEYLHKDYYSFTDEEKLELLHEINQSAVSVYESLENLLQWSLSQRNKTPFNPVFFDFKRVVDSTISQLFLQAKNKKIKINSKIQEPSQATGDVNLITIVVRNLLSNAIKFTREGGSIHINGNINTEANHYLVAIKDNGIGIPQDKLSKLFRIDTSSSTKGTHNESGTGLGLIICKEYIEKNNGKIWAESELEIGTTFYFTIPLD